MVAMTTTRAFRCRPVIGLRHVLGSCHILVVNHSDVCDVCVCLSYVRSHFIFFFEMLVTFNCKQQPTLNPHIYTTPTTHHTMKKSVQAAYIAALAVCAITAAPIILSAMNKDSKAVVGARFLAGVIGIGITSAMIHVVRTKVPADKKKSAPVVFIKAYSVLMLAGSLLGTGYAGLHLFNVIKGNGLTPWQTIFPGNVRAPVSSNIPTSLEQGVNALNA